MALRRERPGTRKIGGHFLVCKVFFRPKIKRFRKKRSSRLIYVQNLYFRFKTLVFFKKESSLSIENYIPSFVLKLRCRPRGLPSLYYYEESEQYFASGGYFLTFFRKSRCGRSVRSVLKSSLLVIIGFKLKDD